MSRKTYQPGDKVIVLADQMDDSRIGQVFTVVDTGSSDGMQWCALDTPSLAHGNYTKYGRYWSQSLRLHGQKPQSGSWAAIESHTGWNPLKAAQR